MEYSDKDWIVIGFDTDCNHLTPIIQMSGRSGLKKRIQGISGKRTMTIYHVNFDNKTCINTGNVNLPQNIQTVDIIIEFKPMTIQSLSEYSIYLLLILQLPTDTHEVVLHSLSQTH